MKEQFNQVCSWHDYLVNSARSALWRKDFVRKDLLFCPPNYFPFHNIYYKGLGVDSNWDKLKMSKHEQSPGNKLYLPGILK